MCPDDITEPRTVIQLSGVVILGLASQSRLHAVNPILSYVQALQGIETVFSTSGVEYFSLSIQILHCLSPENPFNWLPFHSDLKVSMINSPEVVEVKSSYVVLTAGAWSGQLGKLLGIGTGPKEENLHMPIPVEPRKRYVYFFHCPEGPGLECPLLIDPSGSYVRREGFGGNYLCGKSPNVSIF